MKKYFVNPEATSIKLDFILTGPGIIEGSADSNLGGLAAGRQGGAAGPATHVTTINPERMSN